MEFRRSDGFRWMFLQEHDFESSRVCYRMISLEGSEVCTVKNGVYNVLSFARQIKMNHRQIVHVRQDQAQVAESSVR